MAESKLAKLKRFEAKRTEIQMKLAVLATHHEMDKVETFSYMGRKGLFTPQRFRNKSDNTEKQLANLKKKAEMYTRKIDALRNELYR